MIRTVTKTLPFSKKRVEAVRFEIWAWKDGPLWVAASPQLPGSQIKTRASAIEARKVCKIKIIERVVEAKAKGEGVGWREWKPATKGIYTTTRHSIA